MKPADQTPPPPSPEAYGDGSKSEQRGGWNDPPMLDPSRPVKKKVSNLCLYLMIAVLLRLSKQCDTNVACCIYVF